MFHPAVECLILFSVLIFCIFALHPFFTVLSFLGMVIASFAVNGKKAGREILGTALFGILIAFLNPLFSAMGESVLFLLPWGRPYTAEALLFGFSMGISCASVLLWCLVFFRSGGKESFLALLSGVLPNTGLILSLVLRFLPEIFRKDQEIRQAREGIGKEAEKTVRTERIRQSVNRISVLATAMLEDSVDTSDSMKSRGAGCCRRTSYLPHTPKRSDGTALLFLFVDFAVLAAGGVQKAFAVTFYPSFEMAAGSVTMICLGAYALLIGFLIVSLIGTKRRNIWNYLK